ncbi:MAG: CotH kinase family protein, partial [Lachnospiraceae bacterium]|nr:CotH kinase family protein [Lachnospiraceae bacterium]
MEKYFRNFLIIMFVGILFSGVGKTDAKAEELSIPTINVVTETGEDPTCDFVTPPSGYAGIGIINNDYVVCDVEYIDSKNEKIVDETAKIKVRGNTSATYPKKPFMIKFDKKKGFDFCTDKGTKKWVLLTLGDNLAFYISNTVAKLCGVEWQPQFQYVNLTMNGDYRGTYVMVEAADTMVKNLDIDDTGFMIECDPYAWHENIKFMTNYIGGALAYTFKHPEDEMLTDEVITNTQKYMIGITNTIINSSEDYMDAIDANSFASWFLAKDYQLSIDLWGSNIYYYRKNSESKLQMGPTWDFDNDYKDEDNVWSAVHRSKGLVYSEYLFNRDSFKKIYRNEYEKNRSIYEKIKESAENYIDSYGTSLQESWNKNADRWGTSALNVKTELESLIEKYRKRNEWIDEQTKNWSLDFSGYYEAVEEASSYNPDDYENGNILQELLDIDVYDISVTQEELDKITEN